MIRLVGKTSVTVTGLLDASGAGYADLNAGYGAGGGILIDSPEVILIDAEIRSLGGNGRDTGLTVNGGTSKIFAHELTERNTTYRVGRSYQDVNIVLGLTTPTQTPTQSSTATPTRTPTSTPSPTGTPIPKSVIAGTMTTNLVASTGGMLQLTAWSPRASSAELVEGQFPFLLSDEDTFLFSIPVRAIPGISAPVEVLLEIDIPNQNRWPYLNVRP